MALEASSKATLAQDVAAELIIQDAFSGAGTKIFLCGNRRSECAGCRH